MWKYLLLIFLLAFSNGSVFAQESTDRSRQQDADRHERIKLARQAFITEELELTEKEATTFFPIFWDYQRQVDEIKRERFHGRKKGGSKEEEMAALSEQEAKEALLSFREERKKILALSIEVEDRYLTILPAKKVIRLELAERAFRKKLWEKLGEHRGRKN